MISRLYEALADFRNFFQPSMKLREKVRVGGKVRRVYEPARTPYERVLEQGGLKPVQRRALEQHYHALNPVELKKRIDQLRNELFDLLERQGEVVPAKPRSGRAIDLRSLRRASAGD